MSLFDLIQAGKVRISNEDGVPTVEEAEGVEVETEETPAETTEETAETPEEETPAETTEEVEEVEVEETPEEEEIVAAGEELDSELLEVQEEQAEVAEVAEEIQEAEEAAVSTEALLANLLAAKAIGSFGIAHCELAQEHLSYVGSRIGADSSEVPAINYGIEGFSSAAAVSLSTESALKAVGDFVVKIIDSILVGISWILDKGKQLFVKLFSNFDKLESYIEKIREEAGKRTNELRDKDGKEGEASKSSAAAAAHTVGNKIVSTQECIALIKQEAENIEKNWQVGELAKFVETYAKDAKAAADSMQKNQSATGFVTSGDAKAVSALAKLLPAGAKTITGKDAKLGLSLKSNEIAKMGNVLPRNKVIVTIAPSDKFSTAEKGSDARFQSRLQNYKENSGANREVKTLDKAGIDLVLNGAVEIIKVAKAIKANMDKADNALKSAKAIISELRKKYFAIKKEARADRGFLENNRVVRGQISAVKKLIGLMREPGTGFLSYALFELKSLLDYAYSQVKRYKKA